MPKAADLRCKKCKDGKHDQCGARACDCHCTFPSVAFHPAVASKWTLRPIGHCLARLRDHTVVARFDQPNLCMVFKPHPNRLPDEIRALLNQYKTELVRALAPGPPGGPLRRPWWTIGPIRACAGCGLSSASYSPLGECMHQRCGYLGQSKLMHPVKQGPFPVR